MLYFAYGSNMSQEDLGDWCVARNYRPLKFSNPIPVKLLDCKLDFNYYSSVRKAGAANIIMGMRGHEVWGLLVEIEEADRKIIRIKEGWPSAYEEIIVSVMDRDGILIGDVLTYKVVKDREAPRFEKPTKHYLGLIVAAAKQNDFPRKYQDYLTSIPSLD